MIDAHKSTSLAELRYVMVTRYRTDATPEDERITAWLEALSDACTRTQGADVEPSALADSITVLEDSLREAEAAQDKVEREALHAEKERDELKDEVARLQSANDRLATIGTELQEKLSGGPASSLQVAEISRGLEQLRAERRVDASRMARLESLLEDIQTQTRPKPRKKSP